MTTAKTLDVAIIGAGITGVSLGLGLLRRNVNFTIYERASELVEIGAGIGFTPNAERAMKELEPRLHQCFRDVAVQNTDDWFRYVDGFHHNSADPTDATEKLICQIYLGERGFEGCRRSDFLLRVVDLLPKGCVKLGKCLEAEDAVSEDQVVLKFQDGSTARADVVIGCDGINSGMRARMFGTRYPACQPAYAHKFAFRGLIPADKARGFLGDLKTSARFMHTGPDAHLLTFPVAAGKLINVVAFVTDPNPWDGTEGRMVMPATKNDAVEAFKNFGPAVRHVISLLPEELDKWGVFDMYDNPLPAFVSGRLCLAGDAAHASSPHHGAGAGCGIEDALALAELFASVNQSSASVPLAEQAAEALAAYNEVRYERAQWLVKSSRIVGEMYEWRHEETKDLGERWCQEFEARCHKIWDFDVGEMVQKALEMFREKVSAKSLDLR
ncbi:putative monooxygenase [Thozetella sp. PMI_491]|nr:putative monooxygenase [Thozetella sp. PMI_491]